ncbi:nuclear transport factor 2 family protein [Streptomyces sp. NPDC055239]
MTSQHPNATTLRAVYTDLRTIGHYCAPTIALHPAHHTRCDTGTLLGLDAVTAHEQALFNLTHGTVVMELDYVAANDYFGVAIGLMHAEEPTPVQVPFCGVWQFDDQGRLVEHWEHDTDPTAFAGLTPDI